jgi:hypothetical protein
MFHRGTFPLGGCAACLARALCQNKQFARLLRRQLPRSSKAAIDMKRPFLAAALCLMSAISSPAISVTNGSGAVRERDHVKGKVISVNEHSVTIQWLGQGKMGNSGLMHQETYDLTPQTAFRDRSGSSLIKGAHVRIWGHGHVADSIQFVKHP